LSASELVNLCHVHHLSFYLKATSRYLKAAACFLNRTSCF
jgi:hypothetical protein